MLAPCAARPGTPVKVQGSVPIVPSHAGRHDGPARLTFNPMQHLQRAALLLVNQRLVVAFGSHADQAPYQGWVFAYDTRNLLETPWVWSTMTGGCGRCGKRSRSGPTRFTISAP